MTIAELFPEHLTPNAPWRSSLRASLKSLPPSPNPTKREIVVHDNTEPARAVRDQFSSCRVLFMSHPDLPPQIRTERPSHRPWAFKKEALLLPMSRVRAKAQEKQGNAEWQG
jgi:hypothetical protein